MKKKLFFFFLALVGCESKQQKLALRQVNSPVARERAAAVRAMNPDDDESWLALVKAARDGAPQVRSEAATAMGRAARAEAAEGIAPLLHDPDDSVRLAAARALSQKCGERGDAYLRMAFSRSDAEVRAQIIDSLRICGKTPEETLAKEEAERRRKAMKLLDDPAAAQRARGAHELGLLCREQDQQPLLGLLADRDGVAVAAAARALGDCGVAAAAPQLTSLLDEGGEIAAAAAEALLALRATDAARPRLRKLAVSDSDEALPAAIALGPDCAAAKEAESLKAAAVLLEGCPATDAESLISRLLRKGATDPLIPELALRHHAGGPALVDALRREQAARAKAIQQRKPPPENDSAAEIAKATPPGKDRYAQLMARLRERQAAADARDAASARIDTLLRGDDRDDFIAAALRAALQLHAPGIEKVAAAFKTDPDAAIAAAARGEPELAPKKQRESMQVESRIAIWSDDGAARAKACGSADPQLRRLLASADPERRVRVACSDTNETQPRK
jgi:hypothetical protein